MNMTARKRKITVRVLGAAAILALVIWILWGNRALELNGYTVSSQRLPEAFNGYRIAHVSDLHNTEFGEDNETLLAMLRDAKPDIIAITGDLIDSRHTDVPTALSFVQQAVQIAPCYYVTGNHEARVRVYTELKAGMEAVGATVLEDERTQISLDGQVITLIGLHDPSYQTDYLLGDSETVVRANLAKLHDPSDGYTVLLSHRPELFDTYVESGVDLVLCGHAHGGQFRLPFVGGLVAPNQGLFPEYDAGIYSKENTNMLVSKGLGNSILPFRVNNRPEVIFIELRQK